MKRLGPISCMCSLVLLSSCTLTQQQTPLTAEDAAAQQLAASELNEAIEAEEIRLLKEAEERARLEAEAKAKAEAEERAREEAEAKAEAEAEARAAAEERAREEAEAKAEAEALAREKAKAAEAAPEDEDPHLLSSRRKKQQPQQPITPTAEQQEAALKLLAEQQKTEARKTARRKATQAAKQAAGTAPAPEHEEEMHLPGSELRGGLRARRFAPPEEAISRDDNDEPMPNSVELRGLRSPIMKGNLPMNIDGKIIKQD